MSQVKFSFDVIEYGQRYTVQSYYGEYRNLMVLLRDKLFIDNFGECGGIGRCATCMVRVDNIKGISQGKDRNEPVTLAKKGIKDDTIRLSCQLLMTPDLDGATIEIVDQYEM